MSIPRAVRALIAAQREKQAKSATSRAESHYRGKRRRPNAVIQLISDQARKRR